MKTVTITRVQTGEDGTFGILSVENLFTCVTLEPPWKDNQKNISCIPAGEYTVKPHNSYRFKKTYKLKEVPNRTNILFHKGNAVKDTDGCIVLGLYRMIFEGQERVVESRATFRIFSQILKRHSFKLIIKEEYPTKKGD